jgi:hypothetical protein
MANNEVFKDWQVPRADAVESKKLGWLNSATEEGQIWLKSQRGSRDFRKALDILSGREEPVKQIEYRSNIRTNRLKRNIRDIVGALSNIRPIWGYHSDNKAFTSYAGMMNKVSRALYLEQFFDQSIKEAIQWAAATGTGWVRPVYRRNRAGTGKGNVQLLTYGAPSVLPVQLPSNNDWQEAYAVTLLDEMPIYMAHSMFPDYQDRLTPTASQYWYASEIHTAASGNLWKRIFSMFNRAENSPLSDLYIPIRYTTIVDLSINHTGQTVSMGEPGSPWYYEVPSFGTQIAAGTDENGNPLFRKANENDARLYPYRRLMISSEKCLMYDGPAFNWHGELDLVPFCVDDWPFEALGFSLVHDGYDLQCAINDLERGMMDKYRAQLDLPLGYDINSVSKREADQFDPMQPRARIGYDGSQVDKPFSPVVPPEVYRVEPELIAAVKHYEETMDYQHAIRDVMALAKARALGKGMDNLEALVEAAGPIVKMISRSVERSLSRIGVQLKFLILQYFDTSRVMQYIGEDGVSQEIFDYDPVNLVPSHMPGERTTTGPGEERAVPSQYSRIQRARWFAENLRFFIMPHSVHEITQMTYRLMLLQMRQRGLPIDSKTIMEACDVGNFGNHPEGNTIWERYWNEKKEELLEMLKIKKVAEDMGIAPPGGGPTAGGSSKGKGGRPPSGQAPPQIFQKGDGRSGIKES